MEATLNSYPKIYNLGHPAIANLFDGPVVVEEKVDGSQFSFGIIGGELRCRSKGQHMIMDAPQKMFNAAVESILELESELMPGYVYRCEYLQKLKHNVLAYDRVPDHHLALFDIMIGPEDYMLPEDSRREAERLQLEHVPVMYEGEVSSMEQFHELMDSISFLGGQKIEGLVFKAHGRFGRDGKPLMGKHVSERFKEIHGQEWKKSNPTKKDLTADLILKLRTPARWEKAVQHLRERGELLGEPKDIGPLMKELYQDTAAECREIILDRLWKECWPKIARGVAAGLPEWYKEQLAAKQFE